MEKSIEIFISNQYKETLRLSRIELHSNQENIVIHSSDKGTFFVNKFLFNFLSSLASTEVDVIFAPIPSQVLSSICQMLNFKTVAEIDITHFSEALKLLGLDIESCQKLLLGSKSLQNGICKIEVLKHGDSDSVHEHEKQKNDNICSEPFSSQGTQDLDTKEVPYLKDINNEFEENNADIGKEIDTNKQNDVDNNAGPQNINEIKEHKRSFKYKENPKTTFQLIAGRKELKSLECRICGKVYEIKEFTSKGHLALLSAYYSHLYDHKLITECKCKIEFKSKKARLTHLKLIHKGYVKCDQCPDMFPKQDGLEKHMKTIHTTKQCHICSFVTTQRDSVLTNHIEARHKENEQESKKRDSQTPMKCFAEDCEKIFFKRYNLNQHYNRVHITRECPVCHKLIKNKTLQNHIDNVHHNKKRSCCEKCGKGFMYPALLAEHDAVEHGGARFRCRYPQCEFKDREYRDSSNRSTHERKKHGAPFTKAVS